MKLASPIRTSNDIRSILKDRFKDFNRLSSPARGRRYPPELQDLILQGLSSGLSRMDLHQLTGMSMTGIRGVIARSKPLKPRRLEVVTETDLQANASQMAIVIRLLSGICIELTGPEQLTTSLLNSLSLVRV